MTPAMVVALEAIDRLHLDLRDIENVHPPGHSSDNYSIGNPIGHEQIIAISKILRKYNESHSPSSVSFYLDDLLRGSKIYQESPKAKTEPTTSYKALMARLRRDEETRAYERMINPPPHVETFSDRFPLTSNVKLFPSTTQADTNEDDEITYADINRQMALIINILVSIVACSVAIWMASSHWSTPKRLGLSMGGSGMIGIGEVVVYAGYIRRLKEARQKEKKQVEVKEILKTWVIGHDKETDGLENVTATLSKTPNDKELRRRWVG
ncbi:hypothetical protein MMC07_001391 [Pseudocyphellaria aurata]|nr:hypothetical protein [Pseudocyphellaria aurata]